MVQELSEIHGQQMKGIKKQMIPVRIGIQVLYSGVLWLHPAWVTRLHHRWGVNEAEILFQISALAWV